MKKNLFGWLAMATMLVGTSCSSDEVMNDYSPENAIQFGTYLGRGAQGRGTVLKNENIANFGVFASYTGQSDWNINKSLNFMFNEDIIRDVNTWSYDPVKYWPTTKDDRISFFAYAPHTSDANTKGIAVKSANTDLGIPIITYTIQEENLTTQADFTADVIYNKTRNSNPSSETLDSYDQPVYFTLLHELTRVNIYARLDRNVAASTKVNIKKIEVVKKGKFNTTADYTFAAPDKTRGTWGNFTGAIEDLDLGNLMCDQLAPASEMNGYNENGVLVSSTTPVAMFEDDQYLFLIPSNGVDGLATAGDITLRVSYDIVTLDDNLNPKYSVTPAVKEIPLCVGDLKQGVAYVYTLVIGLNEIKLSASVQGWDETGHEEYVDWTDTDKK